MRYKVGDKVRVKSKAWFDSMPKNHIGSIELSGETFTIGMSEHCGKILTIKNISTNGYTTLEGDFYTWTDEMFENGPIDYLQVGTKFKMDNTWYIVCKDNSGKLYGMSNSGKLCNLSQYNCELTSPKQITEIRTYCYPGNPQDSAAGTLIWKKPFNKGDIVAMYNDTYKNYNIGIMLDSNTISCITDIDGKLENQLDKDRNFQLSKFVLADVYQQKLFHDAVMRSGGYLDFDYRWIPFKAGDKVKVFINGCWTSTIISFINNNKIYTTVSYYPATHLIPD